MLIHKTTVQFHKYAPGKLSSFHEAPGFYVRYELGKTTGVIVRTVVKFKGPFSTFQDAQSWASNNLY
jgi:hypothetical protein